MRFPEMVYDLHLTVKNTNSTDDGNKQGASTFQTFI